MFYNKSSDVLPDGLRSVSLQQEREVQSDYGTLHLHLVIFQIFICKLTNYLLKHRRSRS